MTLKQKIYDFYLNIINEKIERLQQVLAELRESSSNETKSTAGDKHETALTMLQIEQKNINGQLNVALEKKVALQKINPALSANKVINGSVIKTNRGYLFVSVALGKAIIDEISVTSLSPQSPLGVKLLGLLVGDTAEINSTRYVIETIE